MHAPVILLVIYTVEVWIEHSLVPRLTSANYNFARVEQARLVCSMHVCVLYM